MPASHAQRAAALVLLVDADPSSAGPFRECLRGAMRLPPQVVGVETGRQAADWLRNKRCDLLLADLSSVADLGDTPEQAMQRLVRLAGSALVLALSDGGSVSAAVAAMHGGAHDHLVRPLGPETLAARLREIAARHGRLHVIVPKGEQRAEHFAHLLGSSSQMQAVLDQLARSAASDAPVFITGESGTGKDLVARALHAASPRADAPFVAVNCAATRDDSAAALFGTSDGRLGAIDRAGGGTVFLDEIGELDFEVQGRLLRLLQTSGRQGEAAAETPADVRLICATARSPMQLISDRRFREDLFYRLHVLPIHLPPLRQRIGDAAELAAHFLATYSAEEGRSFSGIAPDAATLIAAGDWPGNIRQLQNFVRRLVVLYEGGEVTPRMVIDADFEGSLRPEGLHPAPTASVLPMWQQEQRIIESAIESFGGNIALAAAALELSPSTIYRKRQAWAEMDGKRGAA